MKEYDVERIGERIYSPFDYALKCMGRELNKLGVLPLTEEAPDNIATSGNFSIRNNSGFLITGTGVDKHRLQPNGIVYVDRVDHAQKKIYIAGSTRPSRESLIHAAIYSQFPDIVAVIHPHDDLVLHYADELGIPTTKKRIVAANADESEEITRLLKKNPYVNIKEHGQIVMGSTIEEALGMVKETNRKAWKHFSSRQAS